MFYFLPSYFCVLLCLPKFSKISKVNFIDILALTEIMSTRVNTKLCDLSSTNNNDFMSTPIAPLAASAESYG
jgi:hypothetical protein